MKTFKQLLETLLPPKAFGERLKHAGLNKAKVDAGVKSRKERLQAIRAGLAAETDATNRDRYGDLLTRFDEPSKRTERAAPPDTSSRGEPTRFERALRYHADAAQTTVDDLEDRLRTARSQASKLDNRRWNTSSREAGDMVNRLRGMQQWIRRDNARMKKRKGAIPPGTLFMNVK